MAAVQVLCYIIFITSPFHVEELLLKLRDLQSALNTGKDSL